MGGIRAGGYGLLAFRDEQVLALRCHKPMDFARSGGGAALFN